MKSLVCIVEDDFLAHTLKIYWKEQQVDAYITDFQKDEVAVVESYGAELILVDIDQKLSGRQEFLERFTSSEILQKIPMLCLCKEGDPRQKLFEKMLLKGIIAKPLVVMKLKEQIEKLLDPN